MHVTGTELAELARAWEASDPDVAAARAGVGAPAARPPGLALQIDGMGKSYGARTVLRDINLHIAPGSFVALVGRSGCGKSTLLRLLAGLELADTGTFSRDGGSDAQPGDVRLMFQDARLLPWQRVIDNVALGLPRREAYERAREALARAGAPAAVAAAGRTAGRAGCLDAHRDARADRVAVDAAWFYRRAGDA
jgi:sulfonate transport system ATP-binding protein